jgi:hypothetical protein
LSIDGINGIDVSDGGDLEKVINENGDGVVIGVGIVNKS